MPIVAAAIAVAVSAGEALLGFVLRDSRNANVTGSAAWRSLVFGAPPTNGWPCSVEKFAFHCTQGEDGLAKSEREPGTYFEDGKVVFHHRAQCLRRLIVGRMGFVHDGQFFRKRRRKWAIFPAIIGEHHIVTKLNARLHY